MDRTSTMSGSTGSTESPVDDATYNLLQTLTSKLEALDAYKTYELDGDAQDASIYRELAQQDRQAAEKLVEAVKERLARR
jgi:hypothetical protein